MAKSKGKSRNQEYEHFVFKIQRWEPDYSFSVNQRPEGPENYSEYIELKLEALCVEPKKCAGAVTHFILSSRRHYFSKGGKLLPLNEREKWLGELRLNSKEGSYYGGIPHESMAAIISTLISQRLGCIVLRGAPLSRGSSWCQSIELSPRWE
jgi:hypothetical protein